MDFNDFVRNVLIEEVDGISGMHYSSDLAFDLLAAYNSNRSYTCSRYKSMELLCEFWQDTFEYWNYARDELGLNPNPFENPEAYFVDMLIRKAEEILCALPIVQENERLHFGDEEVVDAFLI